MNLGKFMLRYYQPETNICVPFYHEDDGKSSCIVQYQNKSHSLIKNIKFRR